MKTKNAIDIRLLGGADLLRDGETLSGAATRRHPLALLALLATAPGYALSRPKAIGLLWPDADETTGRNRLSSTVYPLRKLLGPDALTAAGDTLRLDPTRVRCDVWAFRAALDSDDPETAVRIYGGPFLDGFYIEGSELFDEMVERERLALQRAWTRAVRALAESAEESKRFGEAVHRWQALSAGDPLDSAMAARLVRALAAAGRRHEALKTAERHIALLDEELGAEPDAGFQAVVEQLRQKPAASGETPEASIAVLFFDAADEESAALGEGIHGGILNRLATVEGLTVIARTSVRQFQGGGKSAAEIGAELNVRWVMEGGVQARHGQFRLDARLVEARGNRQVWGYDYVGQVNADNYFGVQAEIAGELFEQLRHQVTPDERLRLAQLPTGNLEAHQLAAEARRHLDLRSPESMQDALACFENAVALDPDYAVAWVGIADTLGLMFAYGHAGPEVLARAGEAIRTALEADPHSAEAHAAQGRFHGQFKDEKNARQSLRQAVALKPGYAEAHNWLTVGYQISGHIEAAVDSSRRAAALNPLSVEAVSNSASALLYSGDPERALPIIEKVLEREPGYGTASFFAALAHYELGAFERCLESLEGLDLPWTGVGVDTLRAMAHAALGNPDTAREHLDGIRDGRHAFDEGLVLAAVGDRDSAFEAFARADFSGIEFDVSYWPTVCVRYLFKPLWRTLEDDPRLDGLRRRIDESWGLA